MALYRYGMHSITLHSDTQYIMYSIDLNNDNPIELQISDRRIILELVKLFCIATENTEKYTAYILKVHKELPTLNLENSWTDSKMLLNGQSIMYAPESSSTYNLEGFHLNDLDMLYLGRLIQIKDFKTLNLQHNNITFNGLYYLFKNATVKPVDLIDLRHTNVEIDKLFTTDKKYAFS